MDSRKSQKGISSWLCSSTTGSIGLSGLGVVCLGVGGAGGAVVGLGAGGAGGAGGAVVGLGVGAGGAVVGIKIITFCSLAPGFKGLDGGS